MMRAKKFDKANYQRLVIVGVLLVIMLALTVLSDRFLTIDNITNVLRQQVATVIAGCAVTLLMVSGNFDLSIGSIMAIAGSMTAIFVTWGMPVAVAVLIAVLIGTVVGVINGLLVILLDVPSIIATLGTMYAVRGAAWVITGGNSVSRGLSRDFTVLGRGYVGPIPLCLLITAIIFLLFFFIQHKTLPANYAFAIGGTRRTAPLTGTNAQYGLAYQRAVELVEQVNAEGGINGGEVVVDIYDDKNLSLIHI